MDSKKHYDLIRNNVSKIIRTLDFHESFLIDLFDANQKDKIPAREVELYYINLVTYYAYIEPAMLNFYDEGRHGWGRSKKMITSENYQKILKTTLTSYKEDKRKYLNGADLSSLAKFYGEGSVYQIDYDANIAFQEKRADYYTSKISPLQDYFTDNFNFRNPIKKKTSEEVLEDGSLGDWDTD